MLDEHSLGPEEIDVSVVAGDSSHGLFEAGDGTAGDAKNLEEFVPEGLLFGLFPFRACPLF